MNYRIVGICQIYNELIKGNLERFVHHIKPLVDSLVVYDDGSTDGSYEYMLKQTPYVLRSTKNNFANERSHKKLLLQEALKLKPDFILWLDADEVLTANAEESLQELCRYCEEQEYDAMSFHEINLWRSHSWQRIDSLFGSGWFCRLWRVVPGISFTETKPGLHQPPYPSTIRKMTWTDKIQVLHYGFSSKQRLAHKYLVYRSHGQRGYEMLDRLISEEQLVVQKVPQQLFPEDLWIDDEQPKPLTFAESLTYVEQYRDEVFKPKFSIICLIYKSVEWLKFVYEQVFKYTDMTDKEFFFVANDADSVVLEYLRDNYVPHYVHTNTPEQQEEWYINNVYRAYNFAVNKARGDFVVLINSDMAFTPSWFDNLWQAYNGENCVTARLVESGRLRSGQFGVEKDFGKDYLSYQETEFEQYARDLAEPKLLDGGLFMPLLIRKEHFKRVGGYPEGNIVPGSDFTHPIITRPGEPCISGDNVLMSKLSAEGIQHQTAFDSIVYHFQCGELNSPRTAERVEEKIKVAVCNDLITGSMGEKVLWNFLLEALPSSAGVDMYLAGTEGDYAANARNYIQMHHPEVEVVIQNATFINTVDPSRYTIAFLQDNLRSMGWASAQQEENLRRASILVTNSLQTALSYPEHDFEIIPVGVDLELFKPLDKVEVRKELGFDTGRIGIFVGDFSEVKGWSKVRSCIEQHPEITWILVSKAQETFAAPNVRVFNRIAQTLITKLLNCADFFMIGSPVETQCLAAVEACLCDIPVVMRQVGIFKDLSEEERSRCGIFGEDFEAALQELPNRVFSPRQVMIEKKLSTQDSMEKWYRLLTTVSQKLMAKKNTKRSAGQKKKPKISIIITTFQRVNLLKWGLFSLSQQTIPFEFETIVVNDGLQDETEEVCNEFKEKLNLKYIFSGQRNLNSEPVWRIPGFAINIGVKQSSGDILVLCCAEMFHINQTIAALITPILDQPKLLGIPIGKDDRDGRFLEQIKDKNGSFELDALNNCIVLDTRMPFLMAMHRDQFYEIGGYDEDFVGIAYDDNDFIHRLLGNGCSYCMTTAITVHLYHPRAQDYYQDPPEWEYNKKLFYSRMGKIVRNEGREWGAL
ncbi:MULTISPECIES: glycosyltransferase [Desulfosporosinus]|uniref:D-inositol-3-phosphate glycosyltransferase n=1 Tax=Desulfosporosinus acididurans TaxID=476652 RepID=A0A0J1FW07_9FIRM|nr:MULTISPECIES: glycosyltransferase [Desulfosporosinus]KLU67604.1 D-inositol-3-phosphate glycosyltransferase [Desulfosporosinus acididurans]